MENVLLEILACPICKGELGYNRENQELTCRYDRLAFSIINGIPVMLTSRARRFDIHED